MKRPLLSVLLTLAFVSAVPAAAQAALSPGQLDPAFGSGGFLTFDPSLAAPKSSYLEDIATDASGRLLVAGGASDGAGHEAVMVGRLLPDGTPDASFGTGGFVVRQVGQGTTPDSFAEFVGAAPDGGVLVGLERNRTDNFQDVDVLKLDAAGHVDFNYGGAGTGLASESVGGSSYLYTQNSSGVIKPDGSLYLVAQLAPTSGSTPARSAAWLDFSPTGTASMVSTQLSDTGGTLPNAIVGLPSGKFLIGGVVTRSTGGDQSFVARLGTDGQLDTTYGGSTNTGGTPKPGATLEQLGAGTTPTTTTTGLVNGPDSAAYGIASASSGVSNHTVMVVTRYGASGQLDPGFGPSGSRFLSVEQCTGSSFCGTSAGQALVDASGRVVVRASVFDGDGVAQTAIARYEPDGSLDSAFGAGGVAGPFPNDGISMVFGADNRLLFAGGTEQPPREAMLGRLALEPVADPPATPVTTSTPTPVVTPPAGRPTTPAGPVDTTPPKLSALRVTIAARTGRASLTLTSSEAGRLTIALQRARTGHRSRGRCSRTARHGARCTLYTAVRTVNAALRAGKATISLGTARLAVGTYQAVVTATDAAGNRARAVPVAFRVSSAHAHARS